VQDSHGKKLPDERAPQRARHECEITAMARASDGKDFKTMKDEMAAKHITVGNASAGMSSRPSTTDSRR